MEAFDCELLRSGWPAQPVNSVSALAFVVVGVWLWRRGERVPGSVTAVVGAASIWFHSSPGGAAQWGHDVTMYGLIAISAVEVWRLVSSRRPPVLAGAILAAGAVVWFTSRTGGVLCDPGSLLQGHAVWHIAAAVAVAVLFTSRTTAQIDVSDRL